MSRTLSLGHVVITTNADNVLNRVSVLQAIARHKFCDWGECCDEDKESNDAAVQNGDDRIHSVYRDSKGTKFWIITESDRSVTTVLLPEDY
ncbi:MAG: hypothetical protein LBG83_04935 [Oscillospiraceae bacterium]|nr:hypothetical protein [Oscillospiraceae bacterium]